MANKDFRTELSQLTDPQKRADAAAQIILEGHYFKYQKEFKQFLYPGQNHEGDVFHLLKVKTESNPELANAILKLGLKREPFSPEYNNQTWEHEIFISCVESLRKHDFDQDKIRERFVELVFNPEGKRTPYDIEQLNSFLKEIKEKNNLSITTLASQVLAAPNWYCKQLKLEPILNSTSAYFLYAKKKERHFKKNGDSYAVRMKNGYGLIEISTSVEDPTHAYMLSIDYFHHDSLAETDRLIASIDFQQDHVIIYGKSKVGDLIEEEYMKNNRYAMFRSSENIPYKGFNPYVKEFCLSHGIDPGKDFVK